MRLVNVSRMREMEKTADAAGYSFAVMMQKAGEGIAEIILQRFPHAEQAVVLGLTGKGNNGGDTLIALTILQRNGKQTYALIADHRDLDEPLLQEYCACGGKVIDPGKLAEVRLVAGGTGIILDGIFGTGFHPPLPATIIDLLDLVQKELTGFTWIAVDCPSGVDAESGQVSAGTRKASLTICLEAVKHGLLEYTAFPYCGEIVTADLGIAKYSPHLDEPTEMVIDADYVRTYLPERAEISHKGTFGKALIVGGCVNYPGAPVLAGKGAYAVGAGLVQLAIPESIFGCLPATNLEMTWLLLEDLGGVISEKATNTLYDYLDNLSAMVIGPGIGREETTGRFIRTLFTHDRENQKLSWGFPGLEPSQGSARNHQNLPIVVLDADGLYHLAQEEDWYEKLRVDLVLTPHPGEMAALTGLSVTDIQKDRISVARNFARKWGQTLVLKGALTVVADTSLNLAVIPIACSALAKAGSGDVLAGMIGGLLAQGFSPWLASTCGAWLHANAGVRAATMIGCAESVLASDVIRALPEVYSRLRTNDLS